MKRIRRLLVALLALFVFILVNPVGAQEKAATEEGTKAEAVEKTHWLNTSSGVRHNKNCQWFKKTKKGRFCEPDEGRACKTCGG